MPPCSVDETTPSQVPYATSAYNEELGARLLLNFRELNAERDDPINRCGGSDCGRKDEPEWIREADQVLSELGATSQKMTSSRSTQESSAATLTSCLIFP